jgi:galactokinase/mevalonate kinase-like predicted kinase
LDAPFRISSFGGDAAGELYVLDHGGAMYAVVKG